MDLKTRIFDAMKAAMKDRDQVRVAALRLIRDAIQKTELEANQDLDDPGVIQVLARLKKQREESLAAFQSGGREDLAGRERREIEIILEFLPAAMSADELKALVAQAVSETAAAGLADLGKVMKALKGRYEGRAPGKDVSEEVKRQLQPASGA